MISYHLAYFYESRLNGTSQPQGSQESQGKSAEQWETLGNPGEPWGTLGPPPAWGGSSISPNFSFLAFLLIPVLSGAHCTGLECSLKIPT